MATKKTKRGQQPSPTEPKKQSHRRTYFPVACRQPGITFEDCELAILRQAVDQSQRLQGKRLVNQAEIQKMIDIVEKFIALKKLLCYGGTAINNILPKTAQFYDYHVDVPDYDFYSHRAIRDAKELADVYVAEGYSNVEAKSGVHHGTYKVFVNFIPVADITEIHIELFQVLMKHAIVVEGIHYVPPDFLRMNMYTELSRPEGDVSRWEKVLKRLTLLNRHHPVKMPAKGCDSVDIFQRPMSTTRNSPERKHIASQVEEAALFDAVRDVLIEVGVVFFGGYASALYSRYMPKSRRRLIEKHPDFDVIYDNPEHCAAMLSDRLLLVTSGAAAAAAAAAITVIKHEAVGELIPESVEFKVGQDTIVCIYKPIACHSYNTLTINHRKIRVATIDTILSFYLAFLFVDKPMYTTFRNRQLCLVNFLFELEQKNRLAQKGLLRRFTPQCYGTQETLESIRAQKAAKFAELKTDRTSEEYQSWFLSYQPTARTPRKQQDAKKTTKTTKKKKKKDATTWFSFM